MNSFAGYICFRFNTNFQLNLNLPMSHQFFKRGPGVKRITLYMYLPYFLCPKLLKKNIQKKLSPYVENMLSKFQCGFCKGFRTEKCVILEKGEDATD